MLCNTPLAATRFWTKTASGHHISQPNELWPRAWGKFFRFNSSLKRSISLLRRGARTHRAFYWPSGREKRALAARLGEILPFQLIVETGYFPFKARRAGPEGTALRGRRSLRRTGAPIGRLTGHSGEKNGQRKPQQNARWACPAAPPAKHPTGAPRGRCLPALGIGLPVTTCIARALADVGKTTHVVLPTSYSSSRARSSYPVKLALASGQPGRLLRSRKPRQKPQRGLAVSWQIDAASESKAGSHALPSGEEKTVGKLRFAGARRTRKAPAKHPTGAPRGVAGGSPASSRQRCRAGLTGLPTRRVCCQAPGRAPNNNAASI